MMVATIPISEEGVMDMKIATSSSAENSSCKRKLVEKISLQR